MKKVTPYQEMTKKLPLNKKFEMEFYKKLSNYCLIKN